MRRTIGDDVIGVAGELCRLAVQRVAGQSDDAEQARKALLRALFGPVESGAWRVRVDQDDLNGRRRRARRRRPPPLGVLLGAILSSSEFVAIDETLR